MPFQHSELMFLKLDQRGTYGNGNHCKQFFDSRDETVSARHYCHLEMKLYKYNFNADFPGIFRQAESRKHLLYILLTASNLQSFRELQTKNPLKDFCLLQNLSNIFLTERPFSTSHNRIFKTQRTLKRQYVFPKPRKRYHQKVSSYKHFLQCRRTRKS